MISSAWTGSKNRGSRERKTSVRHTEFPPPWKIASGNDRPRGKDRNLCHSFPSDNFSATSHGCNYERRSSIPSEIFSPPFLFGKLYESPSLERKNYEEDESFFVSILEGKKGLCYSWIMLFSIRRTEFSHRLVNCCSMKKWRDKSFAESLNAASNSARLSSIWGRKWRERTVFIAVSRSRSKFRILLGEILNLEEVSMISVIAPCNLKMPSSSFTLSVQIIWTFRKKEEDEFDS